MAKGSCLITGVGPATGLSLVKRFAAGGYKVGMLGRSADKLAGFEQQVEGAKAYPTDVTDDAALADAVARISSDLGPIHTVIHNAGNAVFGDVLTVEPDAFDAAWRLNTRTLYSLARLTAPSMLDAGEGAFLITGATAALRGGAMFSAFASAKAAQRSLAQSMARQLNPKGIHVAYFIIDGVIDTPATRSFLTDKPDNEFLQPSDIAETYYYVSQQSRAAWTFEVDMRPFNEKW